MTCSSAAPRNAHAPPTPATRAHQDPRVATARVACLRQRSHWSTPRLHAVPYASVVGCVSLNVSGDRARHHERPRPLVNLSISILRPRRWLGCQAALHPPAFDTPLSAQKRSVRAANWPVRRPLPAALSPDSLPCHARRDSTAAHRISSGPLKVQVADASSILNGDCVQHQILAAAARGKNLYFVRRRTAGPFRSFD